MVSMPTTGRPKTNSETHKTSSGSSTRSRSYDPRGNSSDRRKRKQWMLSSDSFQRRPGTEGTHVNCTHCHRELDYKTVEADKKDPSGRYTRDNVQPSCSDCNKKRSNNTAWVHPSLATA